MYLFDLHRLDLILLKKDLAFKQQNMSSSMPHISSSTCLSDQRERSARVHHVSQSCHFLKRLHTRLKEDADGDRCLWLNILVWTLGLAVPGFGLNYSYNIISLVTHNQLNNGN
jgi:hypothetical protein